MKIVTYNIQYSRGRDDRFDLPRVAAALDGADIIGLQEVDRFWKRTGLQDQARALAEMLPDHYWTFATGYDVAAVAKPVADVETRGMRRQHGNMILSRWPILSFRALRLPRGNPGTAWAQDRVLLEGVIDAPGGPLRVYVTHLCHVGPESRLPQVEAALSYFKTLTGDGPVWSGDHPAGDYWMDGDPAIPFSDDLLWMGDLNFTPDSAEYTQVVEAGLIDSWVSAGHDPLAEDAYTIRGMSPPHRTKRLDQIFVSPGLASRVSAAWVDQDCIASDHFPSWVELTE
ncbi:MAG: endonuclease/exonuclease/phosphatase family protein [Pseudomonadota bacterium]